MKLYHGSLEQVDKPEIRESDHTLDYGKGFYATTSQDQAEDWVKRRAAFALFEGGVLSKQELIRELKTYKLVDQYLFHTPSSLQYLTFIEAKEVML